MNLRTLAVGTALAIFGLGAAVGIGLAANSISGDSVGLSAAPLSPGESLAPARANAGPTAAERRATRAKARRRAEARRRARERQQADQVPTTTAPPTITAPETELSDDSGGHGRGRGRGGDDSGSSGSSGSGSGDDD